jgi:ketosteroid isomerase-like protein
VNQTTERKTIMDEPPGVQRAREYVDTFTNGDLDALRDFYAEDVVWHVGGRHRLSGDYSGRDALFSYFEEVRRLTGGTLRLEPESIVSSDRYTAMFTRVTAQREGKNLDTVLAQILRNGPSGQWNEYWAVADEQDEVDAFWS